MTQKESDKEGPVLRLTRTWRVVLGLLLLALGGLHVALPALGIDAITVGLLVGALVVVFFDIESFEWQGIKARRLQERVDKAETVVASVEVSQLPPVTPELPGLKAADDWTPGYEGLAHRKPLELNPPVERLERLLWGYEQIRIELIVLAGSGGHLEERLSWDKYRSGALSALLAAREAIPDALLEPIETVTKLRNEIVHASSRLSLDIVASASDLAMDVLIKLRQIKRSFVRVRVANVRLFRDQSLSQFHETAGVQIVTVDEQGVVQNDAVYPRQLEYVAGRFVTWEWRMDRSFADEAWYLDTSTNLAKLAFSKSATFVGREYPTQWGLEYRLPNPDSGL